MGPISQSFIPHYENSNGATNEAGTALNLIMLQPEDIDVNEGYVEFYGRSDDLQVALTTIMEGRRDSPGVAEKFPDDVHSWPFMC